MVTEASRRRDSFFVRGIGLTVVTGLVLVFIVGVVFAVAYGSQRITSSATDLHKADETLRAATVVRAQVALDRLHGHDGRPVWNRLDRSAGAVGG